MARIASCSAVGNPGPICTEPRLAEPRVVMSVSARISCAGVVELSTILILTVVAAPTV
jgi:hypothetical protein